MANTLEAPTSAAQLLKQKSTLSRRIHQLLHRMPALSPLLVLIIAGLAFGLDNDRFLRPENLSIILQQAAVVGALAVGQTLVILTAGIDLSVGAVMVLAQLVMGKVAVDHGVPGPIAFLIGFVVAVLAALFNGILVTKIK